MSYLTAVGIMMLVVSPPLVPLVISGVHAVAKLTTTLRAGAPAGAIAVTD